jgi:hypothetical protein
MKALNPSFFGIRGVVGKKIVAKKANRVSAKCAIVIRNAVDSHEALAARWYMELK